MLQANGFALVQDPVFVDANKRVGHVAMGRVILNGTEIDAPVDKDEEDVILDLAADRSGRSELVDWLRQHVKPPA